MVILAIFFQRIILIPQILIQSDSWARLPDYIFSTFHFDPILFYLMLIEALSLEWHPSFYFIIFLMCPISGRWSKDSQPQSWCVLFSIWRPQIAASYLAAISCPATQIILTVVKSWPNSEDVKSSPICHIFLSDLGVNEAKAVSYNPPRWPDIY